MLSARDRGDDGILVAPRHLSQIFRAQLMRQFGRADKIAEHHRELPMLGLRGRIMCGNDTFVRRRRLGFDKRMDGTYDPFARAQGQAKLSQITAAGNWEISATPYKPIRLAHDSGRPRQVVTNDSDGCKRHE